MRWWRVTVTPDTRIRRTVQASWQDIEGETILLIGQEDKLVGLNPVGARIWHLADGSRTAAEIAQQISLDFEQAPATVLEDTLAFVQLLAVRGLVEATTS